MDSDARNKLFERGLDFEKSGKKDCALKCYLGCLTCLQADSHFVLLPQCLRNVADIYFSKEEYEKAILFIQAEKLFYENALIDSTDIQDTLEKLRQSEKDDNSPKVDENSVRADEFEHLAKLCMDQNQPHLALEYAGKATKIRQQIYGNDHKITKDSLDYFATLYAEVGRKQYSDSMTHLSPNTSRRESLSNVSPPSILRQRNIMETSDEREKKCVRFNEHIERRVIYEENLPTSLTVIAILFGFIVFLIMGTWLFCIMRNDHVCRSFSAEVQYIYTRLRYLYYHYTGNKVYKN
ncbi:hypothetical protein SNE40_009398 [Patella caerulea]|uniref:Consortin N-terminal domain-containing protein n=1 Tax=Patella caerulea TaxID=87958 RepID=A0AAN8PYD5_PATCE